MSSVDKIIVGLGNPGLKYEQTRHNAGFVALDYIAEQLGCALDRINFEGLYSLTNIENKKVILLKPTTYMNLSGQSVLKAMNFYKVPVQKVILVFDDVSLPVGKIRIRKKGSHGGHNGVKSIINLCGSEDFTRIKIGVGEKPENREDLSDWVLSKFSEFERKEIVRSFPKVLEIVRLIVSDKIEEAMNNFN